MALPRRFYSAFLFSAFVVFGAYIFFSRNDLSISNYGFPRTTLGIPFTTENGELVVPVAAESDEDNSDGVKISPFMETVPARPDDEISDVKVPSSLETVPETSGQIKEASDAGLELAQEQEQEKELRISIVETGGSHDEVTAALVHAFGSQPNSVLSLYLAIQRYGIKDIISNFTLPSPNTIASINSIKDFANALKLLPPPHILVSTTCELDLLNQAKPFEALIATGKTYLFCVVHHADRWGPGRGAGIAEKVKPWIEKQMVDFVTLSPHTAQHLRTASIDKWEYSANNVTVEAFPPLFPVNIPEPLEKFDIRNGLSLAMQGDYSAKRRNYTSVFERLGSVNRKVKNRTHGNGTVDLHLIGHGNLPKVPKDVKQQVVFDNELSYYKYYTLLSRQFAVLPAFASDTYFDQKASSSVPAALIAGAPLVASQKLLDAYSYLPREAVWVSEEGESEMQVIERVMDNVDEYTKKREAARTACTHLIERNVRLVREWVAQGLRKVDRVH